MPSTLTRCRTVVLTIVLVLATLVPASAAGYSSAAPQDPGVITLHVQTPEYQLDGQVPQVAGYDASQIPGAPALPVYRTVVELPAEGDWQVSISETGEQLLPGAYDIPAALVPDRVVLDPTKSAPQEQLDQAPMVNRPDPAIYGSDAFYPASPVMPGTEATMRGRRMLALSVFPFQYNPVTRALRYHPDLTITVSITPRAKAASTTATTVVPLNPALVRPTSQLGAAQVMTGTLRIRTGERGLYRLTYSDLQTAGVPVSTVDPATFGMSYLGQPIAIRVTGEQDRHFDPADEVDFYAEPYEGRYMASNVYWFTYNGVGGPRMASRDGDPGTPPVTPTVTPTATPSVTPTATPTATPPLNHRTYLPLLCKPEAVAPASISQSGQIQVASALAATTITRTAHIENNSFYHGELHRPADADHWFDALLWPKTAQPVANVTYNLDLQYPIRTGRVVLRALVHGGQDLGLDPDQSFDMFLNSTVAGRYKWAGSVDHLASTTVPALWLSATTTINMLKLEAALDQLPNVRDAGATSYWVIPDWVELVYPSSAIASNNRLYIEGLPNNDQRILATGFGSGAVTILDVSNARQPVEVTGALTTLAGSSYSVDFQDAPVPGRAYAISTNSALLSPEAVEPVTPSAWGTPAHNVDYIAIVHRSLGEPVQPLLDHRAAKGLRVAKVDVQDIYDEFSYGRVDPEAIRRFLTYAYYNWNGNPTMDPNPKPRPEYVLLVGDGHYDFTGVSGTSLPNLIPPYLADVDPWIGETASDNRYVSIDGGDNLPDMHIGRIPARDAAEVTAAVDKILAYENSATPGNWQKTVAFLADDCANTSGNFNAMSDEVGALVPATYVTQAVYYGSSKAACPRSTANDVIPMNQQIKTTFNSGALLLQWFGHGSMFRWGSKTGMFNSDDVPALNANTVWPFSATYACWTGYFINLDFNPSHTTQQTLGEELVLTPGRGSVADFAPSGLHVAWAAQILSKGLVKAVTQDREPTAGRAADSARAYYYAQSTGYLDVIDTSVLFGDPALQLKLP